MAEILETQGVVSSATGIQGPRYLSPGSLGPRFREGDGDAGSGGTWTPACAGVTVKLFGSACCRSLDPRVRGGDEDLTAVIPVETGIQGLRYLKVLGRWAPAFARATEMPAPVVAGPPPPLPDQTLGDRLRGGRLCAG